MKRRSIKAVGICCIVLLLAAFCTAAINNGWFGIGNPGKPNKNESSETIDVMDLGEAGIQTDDDPWSEMELLIKVYYGGVKQVNYSGRMRLYDDNDEKLRLLEEQPFDYSLFNGEYYYKLGVVECIRKDRFLVLVNHAEQTVTYSTIVTDNKPSAIPGDMTVIKQLILERKAEVKVTSLNGQKILTVNNIEDPTLQGYQIWYDPQTYRIQKMVLGMVRLTPLDSEQAPVESMAEPVQEPTGTGEKEMVLDGYLYKLEIIYEKSHESDEKEFHPEQKFIKFSKNGAELTDGYKMYTLIN